MLGSKHHVCESHTVLHMYTPESTPSALQQCAAPSYTLPRKPHNLIFIHISNCMYVFIYIYMSVCLCVCRVPPPWNLPFWYPPSSPSPEDFFRYPPQLHPRPSAADMPRSLALFSCSNPRLPFDLSPFPLKLRFTNNKSGGIIGINGINMHQYLPNSYSYPIIAMVGIYIPIFTHHGDLTNRKLVSHRFNPQLWDIHGLIKKKAVDMIRILMGYNQRTIIE